MAALRLARQVAIFFHRTFGDPRFKPGPFQAPRPPADATAELQAEIERLRAERDGTHHSPPNTVAGDYRYVTAKNIRRMALDLSNLTYVDEATRREIYARCPVERGDVLYIKDGATTGIAAVNPLDDPFSMLSSVALLKPSAGILDPHYLAHWLNSPETLASMIGQMTGSAIRRLTLTIIARQTLPLPPLAEQRRIVARIEALFARTRQARADLLRIAPLAALHRRATLTVAASGTLTEAWRDAHADLPGTMAALEAVRRDRQRHRKLSVRHRAATAPEIDLPPSWGWVSPDELASDDAYSIGIGPFGSNLVQSDYRPAGVRLVFVRDIRRERFDQNDARYVTPEKADELRPHVVMGGEVLITKMGDPPGDTAVYPCGLGRAVITSDCIKLQPDPRLGLPKYLAYAIRSRIVGDQIGEITKGVAQQKVSLDSFRRIALPTPPIAEQHEIEIRLNTSLSATNKLEHEAARAQALLDHLERSILTRAFRGELVPQDPADEPASVALARLGGAQAAPQRRRGRRAA